MIHAKQAKGQSRARVLLPLLLFFGILSFFIWQLISLQVVQGASYFEQSRRKIAQSEAVEAARGAIVDRNGLPLVTNRTLWQIVPSPAQMGDARDETLLALLALCQSYDLAWQDTLPITQSAPFSFLEDAPARARLEKYAATTKRALPKDAPALLAALCTQYKIDELLSLRDRRSLCGLLYELELRRYGLRSADYVLTETENVAFLQSIAAQNLRGVSVRARSLRQYETPAAAHILGRVGRIGAEEWPLYRDLGYTMDAQVGKDGLERAFEAELHGTNGTRTREYDTEGRLQSEQYSTVPQAGKQLRLTLDLPLQEQVEESLAAHLSARENTKGAAVAILDVGSGAVRALASYPGFSLETFSEDYESLRTNPLQPLFNRALQGLYAPGSTFKPLVALAALEEGIITPETKILDTGRYTYYKTPQPRCWIYREQGRTHGVVTVVEALRDSCNIFFYDIGRRLGIEQMEAYARKFGFAAATGIELSGEAVGNLSSRAYSESLGIQWYEGNVLSAALGQENTRSSPLQLAAYTATLANGGKRYRPHLEEQVRSNDGSEILSTSQPELVEEIAINPAHLAVVKQGMLAVTQKGSVGAAFRKLPVQVGAKTGSAQVEGSKEANAVFICFAPYDDPQIAMAIVVERGASGSDLGKLAAEILGAYFEG